jgi:hypothetical protein
MLPRFLILRTVSTSPTRPQGHRAALSSLRGLRKSVCGARPLPTLRRERNRFHRNPVYLLHRGGAARARTWHGRMKPRLGCWQFHGLDTLSNTTVVF